MTEEEQSTFVAFVASSDIYSHWMPLITTFLGTGCRVGEIIGLRWCDCDFDNGTISINHNLIYRQQDEGSCEMHITTPKTSAGCRTIPMLKDVRSALIQEIMGHSDIGTTMNIYAEATESKKKESFENLDGKIKIS